MFKFQINDAFIKSAASNGAVYVQATQLAESGKIAVVDKKWENSLMVVTAATNENVKAHKLYLIFEPNGALAEYRCSCDASRIWRGACRHVAAALMVINGEGKKDYARLLNDRAAERMFKDFDAFSKAERGAVLAARTPLEEKIKLIPELYISQGSAPSIGLTAGAARMYVVKNITGLLNNVKNAELFSYGKNLSFYHHIHNFDVESAELISFLFHHHDLYIHTSRILSVSSSYYRLYGPAEFTRFFPLSGAALDMFFEMYENKRVKLSFNHVKSDVLFTSEPPNRTYTVTAEQGGAALTGPPKADVIFGAGYAYLSARGALHRIPYKHAEAIQILDNNLISNNGRILFGPGKVEGFLNVLLPRLKKFGLAGDASALEVRYGVHELTTRIYLDANAGAVTLKLNFCYGETAFDAFKDILAANVRRDAEEENTVLQLIAQCGFKPDETNRMYTLKNDESIYQFYKFGLEHLKNAAEVYATDDFKGKSPKTANAKTAFGVRISGRLLEIKPESGLYSMAELMDIVGAFNAKKKFFRLKTGEFIEIDDDEIKRTADFFNALDISKKDVADGMVSLPSYKALYAEGLAEGDGAPAINRDETFSKITDALLNSRGADVKIPETLEHVLRGYQKEGFKWLTALAGFGFGGILADDMGLGKTLQVISLILSQKENGTLDNPSLVVAPTSLIYNWEKEIRRFAPALTPLVVAGATDKRGEIFGQQADIYITTYDLLKRDIARYKDNAYGNVIADEAQYIKNPGTQNAKAIKELKADARFALTGTPIENALSELWSIFDFVMPGFLYNPAKFAKIFEYPIVRYNDESAARKLKRTIAPFLLRRLKNDVLQEIPEKLNTALYAEMEKAQKKIYTAYLMKAKGELQETLDRNMMAESRIKILSHITRLRQICCHPALFMDGYGGGSGKLPIAVETIKGSVGSGHRLLLFSQFTSMLDILKKELDALDIPYFYLDGATSSKKRIDMADRFNAGERDMFLISLKAGGTGLNLTGADVVMHFDPWWNPAVMDQATDRAHRIGQKNVVQVYSVVAKDSIEEKILALQEKKRGLTDMVIEDGAQFIGRMTQEEIAELFA